MSPDKTNANDTSVVFAERAADHGRCVAFARLNAERARNALSQSMVDALQPQLNAWAARDDVACVVLHGTGEKAFCAGGDIIGLYQAMRAAGGAPSPAAEHYFASEYRLDHTVHRYPKPVLCWGTGTVMGGGLGLLAASSHRVVTEASTIAMPEVTLGLFPDVGAGWFLGRMPNHTGLFLALTTTPLAAGDALWLNLADYYISSNQREALFDALTELDWQADRQANDAVLARALRDFEDQTAAEDARASSVLFARQGAIARLSEAADVAAFQRTLAAQADADDWYAHGAKAIASASPTSLTVVHRQLAGGDPKLSIEQVLRRDLAIAVWRTRLPDFAEGVRALLVDKDKKPQWTPARLEEVTEACVADHFALPDDYREHPLADL
jgi:enoyl-CoA hydratase/carnithine racemase